MAKTSRISRSKKLAAVSSNWSPHSLALALKTARKGDRVAALKRSGILTNDGRVAKQYKNWGRTVTRTPSAPRWQS